ncbi:uncharacterized protein LOC131955362 isoform X2 [Physella acuta]|uniref:uncharacterized protein LOC131955362 isoform X2 n=1 Tax=Physella acuta TaxID=109671 RepID=UPI0027DC1684|nr:uncharacterized protein LOC131955362 isoform X2 [Physella acuta]
MPKSPILVSRQAIKRSLKTKLKLISTENKILIETINGYVQNAEKMYSRLEAASEITPRQFTKAMEKLETAYSACVKLILMATELFDQDDKSESSSEASTKESSTAATGSTAETVSSTPPDARPTPAERETCRRLRKLELRFHDYVARKEKASQQLLESPPESEEPVTFKELTISPKRFDPLVRPDISGDLDNFIEFQRFLYGLGKGETHADDFISPLATEKQQQHQQHQQQQHQQHQQQHQQHQDLQTHTAAGRLVADHGRPKTGKDNQEKVNFALTELNRPVITDQAHPANLQNSIIKKLDNLEKAIQNLNKCSPVREQVSGLMDDDPHGQARYRPETNVTFKRSLERCENKFHGCSGDAFGIVKQTKKMLDCTQKYDDLDMPSPVFSAPQKNYVVRSAWEMEKPNIGQRSSFSDCGAKGGRDVSAQNSDSTAHSKQHCSCPCQCVSSQMQVDSSKKYLSFNNTQPKRTTFQTKRHSSDECPCDKFKNPPKLIDSEERVFEQEEMVKKIIEMVNSQLLPNFRTARSLSRPESPMFFQDDEPAPVIVSRRPPKKPRSFSAPSYRKPENGNSGVTGEGNVEEAKPRSNDVAPDDNTRLQQKIISLASELFQSVASEQIEQMLKQQKPQQDTRGKPPQPPHLKIQHQLQELRCSLDDIQQAQNAMDVQADYTPTAEAPIVQHLKHPLPFSSPLDCSRAKPPARFKEEKYGQQLEPLTIEIHDYQCYPGGVYTQKDFQADQEKSQIRQHAKFQMQQQRQQQKQQLQVPQRAQPGHDISAETCSTFQETHISDPTFYDVERKSSNLGLGEEAKDDTKNNEGYSRHVRFLYIPKRGDNGAQEHAQTAEKNNKLQLSPPQSPTFWTSRSESARAKSSAQFKTPNSQTEMGPVFAETAVSQGYHIPMPENETNPKPFLDSTNSYVDQDAKEYTQHYPDDKADIEMSQNQVEGKRQRKGNRLREVFKGGRRMRRGKSSAQNEH